MPNTSEKVRIHNKLIELALAGPYYAVTYDKTTKNAADLEVSLATPVAPASAQANELAASFEVAARHGRDYKRDRAQWIWAVLVRFNSEVTAYQAEEAWLANPPIMPRDAQFGRQVTIDLLRSTYEHPTTQQSHGGTQIEFNFEIRFSRR